MSTDLDLPEELTFYKELMVDSLGDMVLTVTNSSDALTSWVSSLPDCRLGVNTAMSEGTDGPILAAVAFCGCDNCLVYVLNGSTELEEAAITALKSMTLEITCSRIELPLLTDLLGVMSSYEYVDLQLVHMRSTRDRKLRGLVELCEIYGIDASVLVKVRGSYYIPNMSLDEAIGVAVESLLTLRLGSSMITRGYYTDEFLLETLDYENQGPAFTYIYVKQLRVRTRESMNYRVRYLSIMLPIIFSYDSMLKGVESHMGDWRDYYYEVTGIFELEPKILTYSSYRDELMKLWEMFSSDIIYIKDVLDREY